MKNDDKILQMNKIKSNIKTLFAIFISVFVISFLLNYVWETFHGAFLFEEHNFAASTYVPHLAYMAIKDTVIIMALYLLLSMLNKDLFWIENMNRKHVLENIIIGVVVAFIIEYRAVYVTHEWQYSEHMPVIFGIGMSPLVQLSITMLAAVWVTRRIVYFDRFGSDKKKLDISR